MQFKFVFSLSRLLLLVALVITPSLAQRRRKRKLKCNRSFLIGMGFLGLPKPKKMNLEMCPKIDWSCCTENDQLEMYKNWRMGREEENLEERLRNHREIYEDLMDKALEVYDRAKKTLEKTKTKSISNCKILARRLALFRIDLIAPKLEKNINYMHDFLLDSHRGFYCAICDAEQQRFFEFDRKRIVFSERFCREIVFNSLHVLLYLHAHFTKYLNLMTKFTTNCSFKGDFKEKLIPRKYLFSTKADHHRSLTKCQKNRNRLDWIDSCRDICKNFNLIEFNSYFRPKIKKLKKYNTFIGKELRKISDAEHKYNIVNGLSTAKPRKKAKKSKKARILAEAKKDTKKNTANLVKKKPNKEDLAMAKEQKEMDEQLAKLIVKKEVPAIYKSASKSDVPIASFKSVFKHRGINLYQVGKMTLINDHFYDSIKTISDLKSGAGSSTYSAGSSGTERLLLGWVIAVVMFLVAK